MSDKKYKYVVFDFDGVVCNSTNECMVTSWNAWDRWNKGEKFRRTLNKFTQTEIDAFRSLRPYVRGAGEYYILMRAIHSPGVAIVNQNDYESFYTKWKAQLDSFKKLFFIERKRLREDDIENWINLHEMYDDVIVVMKNLYNSGRLLIATLKDSESVKLLLKKYGIEISSENILGQSEISSKLEALNYFVSKKIINKKEICLMDDNLTHLIEPHNHNYNVFLTGWGNTLEEHKERAIKENIPILKTINERNF